MSGLNVELLKDSFEALKPVAAEAAEHFYGELFSKYPEAKALFDQQAMPKQKMALINSLVFIFDHLEDTPKLSEYLKKMGRRHAGYGVEAHQYEWVAESLITTLRHFFGDTWTTELESAWREALGLIATIMLDGAAEHAEPPGPTPVPSPAPTFVDQIENSLKEVMKATMDELLADKEITKLARAKAKALIQQALDRELADMKVRFNGRKAA